MTINYTVTLSDPHSSLTAQEAAGCVANLRAALEIYSRHLQGEGVVDVLLRIGTEGGERASGRSPEAVFVRQLDDGRYLAEPGAVAELRTGADPNGATCDIELTLAPSYLRSVIWLDPDPATRATPVPAGKFDAVSLFLHEIGHGFGFNGYGDEAGNVAGKYLTTYDALVRHADGNPLFTGAEATEAYGRPVPLSTGELANYMHYGRVAADGLNLGAMEGATYSPAGVRWYIDRLDLAFFRDLGLNAVENPIADVGGSRFQGHVANDDYVGGVGADTIDGGAGDDRALGGAGNDSLTDPAGSNYLRGEEGDDRIVGGISFDDINGNAGNDTANGGYGDDWVVGGRDQDLLFGDAGNDLVYGNLGHDTLHGGDGADVLRGGQGDDLITGGAGDDFLAGDRGADTLSGGAGADTFHAHGGAGLDRVVDFRFHEGDRVNLAPGTKYAAQQIGGDTVVDMEGGGRLILADVQLAQLSTGWLFGA